MPAPKITPEIEKIIIELYTGTHPEYLGKKFGAGAISTILLEKHNITLTRSPVGKHIKKLIKNKTIVKVPGIEKAATIAQRGSDYGKVPSNYMVVKEITKNNRIQSPGRYPEDKKFKVQLRKDGKSTMAYFNTRAEGELAIAENSYVPVDPTKAKTKRAQTRAAKEKLGSIGASKKDDAIFKEFKGGITKLNKYFKDDPDLINNSNFGKNIKKMLAFRLDKNSPGVFSKLQSDNYYKTKAQQGQLFDVFHVNPVEAGKRGGKSATNYNLSPNTFNRAFVGSQLTNFFKKGVNEDTANSLDELFKKYNIRVDLPNVGKIGAAGGDVAFDSKTGSFPRALETLDRLEAPDEVKNFFRSIAELQPGSKSFKAVCTNLKASGGTIDSCLEIVAKDPEAAANKFKNLDVQSGPLAKVKSAANTFLNVAKKGGRFGAFAAVGAAGAGLVKEFRNDDPSTYLSNENQQKNMLIDMLTQPVSTPTETPSTAFGDAQLPAIGAVTAAGMIPGGAELYKQRTGAGSMKRPLGGPRLDAEGAKILKNRVSPFRAALGPLSGVLGKGLAATGTPLGMLALEPLYIGQQIADGDSAGEIATNPLNYLGPAFAGSLSKEATRFAGPKMANIMRLGISPMALKTVSRRFGLPGLGISAGISAYEMYQNKKAGRGLFDDG
jgi:glycine cleavage system H lipoate-binding protein